MPKKFRNTLLENPEITVNKAIITDFFNKYPELKKYQSDVTAVYKKRNYKSIWYDDKKIIDFAAILYAKVNQLEQEGLQSNFPCKDKIDGIFDIKSTTANLSQTDTEIMLSSMYVFYAKKVFFGIDTEKIQEIGWFLPRKNLSYEESVGFLVSRSQLIEPQQ